MSEISKGLANGLTNYGDPEFAKYLRRSFAKSMGLSNESLDKPIVEAVAPATQRVVSTIATGISQRCLKRLSLEY